jgi:hypothetical protein
MRLIALVGAVALLSTPAVRAAEAVHNAVLYKNPSCDCCDGHAAYLRESGFVVDVVETPDLEEMKAEHGVPEALAGCHTIVIDGYIVEGHVPAAAIHKLITEKPDIVGISLPGMPLGSPGMGGEKEAPFVIQEITVDGAGQVFATE